MEEKLILARFIEFKRKKLGLTQEQTALIMGMRRATYQDREKGCGIDLAFLREFSECVLNIEITEFVSQYESFRRSREIQL